MLITLHNLKVSKKGKKKPKRIGRGGKRGGYSGRGQKGQRARSGGKSGLKLKGFKSLMQKIPKLRGFKSKRSKMEIVNLEVLEKRFKEEEIIDPKRLKRVGLVDKIEKGVKILGKGKLSKKLTIKSNAFSKSAKDAIIKAGGKAIEIKGI